METARRGAPASPPLGHGTDGTPLGYVVALTIEDRREGTRFVHASDVQGPLSPVAAAYLARQRPTLLYLSGPPAYLESQLGSAAIEPGVDQLLRIIDPTGCRVIIDHYAVRDAAYPARFRAAVGDRAGGTAAGFLGLADPPLEARRLAALAGPAASRRCRSRPSGPAGSPRPAATAPARASQSPAAHASGEGGMRTMSEGKATWWAIPRPTSR